MRLLLISFFILFTAFFATAQTTNQQFTPPRYSVRFDWNFNAELEYRLSQRMTLIQGIGPDVRVGLTNDVGSLNRLNIFSNTRFTYYGGLRYYFDQKLSNGQSSSGFEGRYIAANYNLNLDGFLKTDIRRLQQGLGYSPASVSLGLGYQKNLGRMFYMKAEVGIGYKAYSPGNLYPAPSKGSFGPTGKFTIGMRLH